MQMDRDLYRRFDTAYEVIGIERRQEPGHVFDTEGIRAQIFELLGHVDETVDAVDGTDGIADGGFDMFAAGFHFSHGPFDVANIIQRVEDAEDVDAIGGGPFDEPFQHIVGVVSISDQVLPAEQHLELGIGHAHVGRAVPRDPL